MDMQAKLEVTVISAVNLKNVSGFGGKMRTYVVVGIDTSAQLKTTRIDTEGGSFPTWNHSLQLDLGLSGRVLFHRKDSANLTIHVYCKTAFGKKLVGWIRVPFSDIVEGYRDPQALHFLSYRLKTGEGEPQSGIINLCVRLLPKDYSEYSEQPCFNPQSLHYSEQGNFHPQPQKSTGFLSGPYHPSQFHQTGPSNAAYCFPQAAPVIYPPPQAAPLIYPPPPPYAGWNIK